MLMGLAVSSAAMASACLRPGVFVCASDASCVSLGVQGVCQPSGYCSYPAGGCESGQRYDEFAGEGLADTCTEPPPAGTGTTTTDPTLGTTTTGTSTDTSVDDSGTDDTETCPPPAVCEDYDGDGYGQGPDCLGSDCDDDNPAHYDQCVYVSPTGDDAADGTAAAPWLTFERALPELSPGMSLVLLEGDYTPGLTGLPDIRCGDNAVNGTAEAPISIRAQQERVPALVSDGSRSAFEIDGCQHWRLYGLRGRAGDLRGSEGGQQTYVFRIGNSQDIVARRLLFSNNNRYYNTHLYGITGSQRVLLEESEAYDFHRDGFFLVDTEDVTLRRCYARSEYPDLLPCNGEVDPETAYCSGYEGGDAAFATYRDVVSTRFENCIADGPLGVGFNIGGSCHDNLIIGSAAVGSSFGIIDGVETGLSSERNAIVDSVVVQTSSRGAYLRSATDASIDHLTVVDVQHSGLSAHELLDCTMFPGGCSFEARHVLSVGSAADGITISGQDSWLVERSNAFGSGAADYDHDGAPEDIADRAGNIRSSMSMDPGPIGVGAGQCVVYIPDQSPMKGAGLDGSDLGATMLYRIEGELTDEPLWDPRTGAFTCGATVAGVNDDPAVSCSGVHERLNVGGDGCALPEGYGGAIDPCDR